MGNYLYVSGLEHQVTVLKKENAKLKRLLKMAVDDMETLETTLGSACCERFEQRCDGCVYEEVFDSNGCYVGCKWQHAGEAMKLIGGEE